MDEVSRFKMSKHEWPEGADFTPWDMSSRDALMRLSPLHNAALAAEQEISKKWFDKWSDEKVKREQAHKCLDAALTLADTGTESEQFHSPVYNAVLRLRAALKTERTAG